MSWVLELVTDAAKARRAACVSQLAVHGLVIASDDRELWDILNKGFFFAQLLLKAAR